METLANAAAFLPSTSVLVAFLAVYFAYLVFTHRNCALGTNERPDLETRPGYPIIGNLLEFRAHGDRIVNLWIWGREQKTTNKPLSFTVPGKRFIDVSKPELIEAIQKTNFSNYVKGPATHARLEQILGDGIFAVDGKKWHSQRKATSKIFNANSFRGIITQSLDANLEKLLAIIRRHADKGEEFSLDALFFRFTLNSFADLAFGVDVGALSTESDEPVPFAAAFDFAQSILALRFTNPFWKITERFSGQAKAMEEASKVLDDFAFKIIDERVKQGKGDIKKEQKDEVAGLDLLSLCMALRDENGQPMSRRALRDAVLNLIIAGRDTTAQALSWTMFHLLTRPEFIDPIRTEVEELGVIDYDSYKNLHQTNAVFSEGLRLHPSVPKAAWQALGDDVLPGGLRIEKGDFVLWSDLMMGRDEEVWGEDAKEFKPSRWVDEKGELRKESQFKAHMFNSGYRLCLGQDLAKYEASAVLAAVLREFDLSFAPDYLETVPRNAIDGTPEYAPSLTLPMLAPLRVIAKHRTKA
ncbi:putative cytochrome P450 monooxygenase [Leucosporidium creatinivorum]|uniref:Putative cytochrome P450 monooxygenase n=1 Tax=Leucosporidium creatinivorum TaxID=106004 RepID=A0A1Y2DWM8_9BASI|nr:putative cytochrome P450 monooxygenase [Leucosporidium creatinivorum]